MVVWATTLLGDIYTYIRIINYMRLTAVRIDVVPDTVNQRKKVVNIVTGSSRSAKLVMVRNTSCSAAC